MVNMPASEFRDTFVRMCKDTNVEPQECVLQAIKSSQGRPAKSGGGRLLSLATNSLTVNTCAVLGKVLATDRCFTEICFNDCMLAEDAVRALANGLASNVACKKLDMKGNNIRGKAAEALGRMLRENNSLLSLCLEWNAVGMIDTPFAVFCEGLANNRSLQILDLRNNQINHEGAAELGAALKQNNTLRGLDLRWNNIGLIGGRHLLHSLESNKTIVRMDLAGNNIPNDVMKSIDTCIAHNADLGMKEQDHQNRQQMLSKQIRNLKMDKVSEVSDLLTKMDRQEASMKGTQRSFNEKINHLQDALEERRDQFNTVASKLAMAESELALSESKVNELGAMLEKAREQAADQAKLHQLDLKREREDRAVREGKFNKELMDLNEKNMQLMNKVEELEMKCRGNQENVFGLKEQLGHAQAEYKLKGAHYEERIQLEKQKTNERLRDADDQRKAEVARCKAEMDEIERSCKSQLQFVENQKREVEEQLMHVKNQLKEQRIQSDHDQQDAVRRTKAEQEATIHELEERVRGLTTAKDDLQSHVSQRAAGMSDLQAKNSNLSLENETLKCKANDLNQQIAGKNSEIMAAVGKVEIEMNARIMKLEGERKTKQELYDKIEQLDKELKDTKDNMQRHLAAKDAEINELKEKVRHREADLRYMREEEATRSALLTSAIQTYISRPPAPESPPKSSTSPKPSTSPNPCSPPPKSS